MTILKFAATAVAAQITHARGCGSFLPNWDGAVDQPALMLIVGNGVQLRSNGIDAHSVRSIADDDPQGPACYADGMNPFRDHSWMDARKAAFPNLTGQFYTDILDDVQVALDRGQGVIRLATDGQTIRVFANRASDYLIGGIYRVPSGLGGTFRVILKDVCDTFALVRNCGNSAGFDDMLPYRVALDDILELEDRRAA